MRWVVHPSCAAKGADVPDVVFLDFEASSLGKHGFPIEVAWASDSGTEESHLIRPAPSWTEWAADSEAVHGITRERLMTEGTPHDEVARRMVAVLTGHALYATAPSWDGQWMSRLLRAAGLPRHALRLQDTEIAHREAVIGILQDAHVPAELHEGVLAEILTDTQHRDDERGPPAHRALADARRELQIWRDARLRAQEAARRLGQFA